MRRCVILGVLAIPLLIAGRREPSQGLLAQSDPKETPHQRPIYKNPLDITVDASGHTAQVVLSGTRKLAVVDLATGMIKEERPLRGEDQRLPPGKVIADPPATTNYENGGYQTYTRPRRGAVAAGGKLRVFAHDLPNDRLPATQIAQGWVFMNVIELETTAKDAAAATKIQATLDEPFRAAATPSDVAVSPGEGRAYVASAGSDAVIVVDLKKLQDYHAARSAARPAEAGDRRYVNDLSGPSRYVIARIPTQANPRRLALSGDGKTLVVSNYLSDSLTVIDATTLQVVRHISLQGPEADAARQGEVLFHSARLTQFGQFTCASCHPNGGADGLNWDLPRDGIGNFKNTKSLLGVKDTAPYGWLGSSPTLADRVAGTLRTLHRYEPEDADVRLLVAYLESLPRPAASYAANSRGKDLFSGKARCDGCHRGPLFEDGREHDVGTGTLAGEHRFNTPSLRGLAATAPYLHDGSAATIEEVFTRQNSRRQHGDAHKLTPEELADLIAYLKSL